MLISMKPNTSKKVEKFSPFPQKEGFKDIYEGRNTTKWYDKPLTKKELEDLEIKITEKIEDMKQFVETGCTYDGNFKNVKERYKRDDEMFMMVSEIDPKGWANTMSASLFKNHQAVMSELSENVIIDQLKAYSKEDLETVPILEKVLETMHDKNGFGEVDMKTFEHVFRYGKGYQLLSWKLIQDIIREPKKFRETTQEERDLSAKKKYIPYKWKKVVHYDDLDVDDILPEKILIERGAYRIHSRKKPANRVGFWEDISYDDFAREVHTLNNVYWHKVEQVRDYYNGSGMSTNPDNEDATQLESVRRTIIYDKIDSAMYVLYNGKLVSVDILPFGIIPIFDYSFMDWKDNFFVPGMGALLDPQVREQNQLFNDLLNRVKMEVNPPMFVDSNVSNEMAAEDGEGYALGEVISITGLNAMRGEIFKTYPVGQGGVKDGAVLLDSIENTITQISGVNPRRHGSMHRSYNATEVQVVDASTIKVIKYYFNRFLKARAERIKLELRWISQEYSKPLLFDLAGEKHKEPKPRTITINNEAVKVQETTFDRRQKKKFKAFSKEIELTKENLKLHGDFKVTVHPETVARMEKPLKRQMWERLLPQIIPLAGDPRYIPPGQPMPYYNLPSIMREHAIVFDLEDHLIQDSYDEEEDIELAIEQMQEIIEGEIVSGSPGVGVEHMEIQDQARIAFEKYIEDLKEEMQEIMPDPAFVESQKAQGYNVPIPPQAKAIKDLEYRLKIMDWHISTDRTVYASVIPSTPPKQEINPMLQANQLGGMQMAIPQVNDGTPPAMGDGIVPPMSEGEINLLTS